MEGRTITARVGRGGNLEVRDFIFGSEDEGKQVCCTMHEPKQKHRL